MLKWDKRFLELASLVSGWSKDPSTKVGAVITKGNRVVSLGYNGYPTGVKDKKDTREVKYLKTIHAEENAILFSKQDLTGCTIYVTHPPCSNCAAKIIQVGITRVVVMSTESNFMDRWKGSCSQSVQMFSQVEVEYVIQSLPI